MFHRLKHGLAVSILLAVSGSVLAQQIPQVKPEEAIHYRKAGYSFANWNMLKIKAMLEGTVPFSKEQVMGAASVINSTVNSGMGSLYLPGTDQDIGGEKTRLKPEFFSRSDKVKEVASAYRTAGNNLATAAATGDKAQIKLAFDEMSKTCKGCHDAFRKD